MRSGVEEVLDSLIGKTVSVMIQGYKGKEAYVGTLEGIKDEWIWLRLYRDSSTKHGIEMLICRVDIVLSVLKYVDGPEVRSA